MSVLALLRHPAVVCRGGPAEQSVLDAIAERYTVALPRELIDLWDEGQRVVIDDLSARFLSPAEILAGTAPGGWCHFMVGLGWMPLLNDNQSNYAVLAARGPLAYRVVWMPHDDGASLRYRDLNSFALGLLDALHQREYACVYLPGTPGDYAPAALRTVEDRADAWELLARPHETDEWNFAIQLLGEEDLDEWARLLETEHSIRRHALARLGQMHSEPIRQLLERDRREFVAFRRAVVAAARTAGFPVNETRDGIQINGRWKELEGFFYRRHIPDAMPRLMAFFADQAAGRNPHDRPGHFFAD